MASAHALSRLPPSPSPEFSHPPLQYTLPLPLPFYLCGYLVWWVVWWGHMSTMLVQLQVGLSWGLLASVYLMQESIAQDRVVA